MDILFSTSLFMSICLPLSWYLMSLFNACDLYAPAGVSEWADQFRHKDDSFMNYYSPPPITCTDGSALMQVKKKAFFIAAKKRETLAQCWIY